MLKFVFYSHTDYLDILNVQLEYITNIQNKVLLINNNNLITETLRNNFDEIIFYDDSLPYANRLLSLENLEDDFIVFIHDIDILLTVDLDVIFSIKSLMKSNSIDRVDLQYFPIDVTANQKKIKMSIKEFNFEIVKHENINSFIYNVNPSIWRLSVFMDIMKKFKSKNYRIIEDLETQLYCKKFELYKLYHTEYISCGYFKCLPFFQFLHITHGGGLLPKNINSNGLTENLQLQYEKIFNTHKFNNNRNFRLTRW